MALLERDTSKDYRSGRLEDLGDLTQYRIVIATIVSAPPHLPSSFTTAAVIPVNGRLRLSEARCSHVGSSASLSGAMSTGDCGSQAVSRSFFRV